MEYKQGDVLERYEEVVYDLQNPIKLPANGATQNKNSYKFYVDSTGKVTAPNDWYNSFLEIDVEVNKKADGTTYAAANNITFASDAYSIIRELNVKYGGVQVIDTPNVNESVRLEIKQNIQALILLKHQAHCFILIGELALLVELHLLMLPVVLILSCH